MTTEAEHNLLDTQETLSNLHISSTILPHELSPNPWQDSNAHTPNSHGDNHEPIQPMKAHDISSLDLPTAQGLAAEQVVDPEPLKPPVRSEILDEFDPLAGHEEKAAREAWETAESHPLPTGSAPSVEVDVIDGQHQRPPPPVKDADSDDLLVHPTYPLSSFSSLAALARTFALPITSRQRPRSLDTATAVPSPATLSSFASQQQMPVATVSAPSSGRSTPQSSAATKMADGDPPQFDFQRFLDQMKLKAAEPVAKYLRSYVCVSDRHIYPINHICRFLSNFAKRTFTVADQVKLINDFLNVRTVDYVGRVS